MANYCILLALLFVGGFASPTPQNDMPDPGEDMSNFFDRKVNDPNNFILGGHVAGETAFPWMVAMTHGVYRTYFCGGSVITTRHVLTAAHCIDFVVSINRLSPTLRITVGSNLWNSSEQMYELQSFKIHEQFDPFNFKYDIGILTTKTAIVMNNRVQPIPLDSSLIPGDVSARVSGWGYTVTDGAASDVLLELHTKTVDGPRCVEDLASVLSVDPAIELCTFNATNKGTCSGDSGSALVSNSNNRQIGIVSWGLPCGRGVPDVYVRVSAFIDWITKNTGKINLFINSLPSIVQHQFINGSVLNRPMTEKA